ncbi:MAG: pilus assembly protein TadG-related protein [Oryzihumus sp.]
MRLRSSGDRGYVALLTAFLLVVFLAVAAFAVDVGNWYLVGQREQRAADAAALAGVSSLPADTATAFSTAQKFAKVNGFENGVASTTVVAGVDSRPTRLRVTVSRTVANIFGPVLGLPTTTVSRTAVADYAGPVPMGSPCNEFGNDPASDSTGYKGTTCNGVNGQFWASVNSPSSFKGNGDAYQSQGCTLSGSPVPDGCASGTNADWTADGYYYTVSVTRPMANLTIQLFDPAWVNVGLTCPSVTSVFGSGSTAATKAVNDQVSDPATRYASGASSPYCTGDNSYGGATVMSTRFTVRDPSTTPWDPATFPVHTGCDRTYAGYDGSLYAALNKASTPTYRPDLAASFRRWSTLCSITNPAVGDYLVQVRTNGLGTDAANDGNRFGIRAWSSADPTATSAISISGREKMGIYSNAPGATTEFYLARVPSSAAGEVLNVRLYDIGDSTTSGTITISAPPDSGATFSGCVGAGPVAGSMPSCSLTADSSFNGKWQTVSVPIPTSYRCADSDPTACWVRLTYAYGTSSKPTDVTSWTASIEGDPTRLVE